MNTANLNELYDKYVERETQQARRKFNDEIAEKWKKQIEEQRGAVIAGIKRQLRRRPRGSFRKK